MLRTLWSFLVCLLAFPALAQTGELYGRGIDESQVLVRLINTGSPEAANFRIGPVRLIANKPGDATPYHPIASDLYILRFQDQVIEFIPEIQRLYTITAGPAGLRVYEDEAHRDPLRAQIYLYNDAPKGGPAIGLTSGPTLIFSGLEPGKSEQIAVNAIDIDLSLTGVEQVPAARLSMERGGSYAIFLVHEDGLPRLLILPAEVAD